MPSLKGPSLAAGGVRGILQTGGEVLFAGSQLAQILTGWLALIFLENLLLYLVLGRHLLLLVVPEPPSCISFLLFLFIRKPHMPTELL